MWIFDKNIKQTKTFEILCSFIKLNTFAILTIFFVKRCVFSNQFCLKLQIQFKKPADGSFSVYNPIAYLSFASWVMNVVQPYSKPFYILCSFNFGSNTLQEGSRWFFFDFVIYFYNNPQLTLRGYYNPVMPSGALLQERYVTAYLIGPNVGATPRPP